MDGSSNCRSGIPDTAFSRSTDCAPSLRAVGEERYHHQHPFHLMMHEGRLNRGQLQAWALNRYYYQSIIPIKDSIILSRGPDPAFRRAWRKRVIDHDGDATSEGGIKRWLKLAEATGLSADQVDRNRNPSGNALRRQRIPQHRAQPHLLEAVASSLTELFSRDLISLAHGEASPALSVALGRAWIISRPADAGSGGREVRHPLCL